MPGYFQNGVDARRNNCTTQHRRSSSRTCHLSCRHFPLEGTVKMYCNCLTLVSNNGLVPSNLVQSVTLRHINFPAIYVAQVIKYNVFLSPVKQLGICGILLFLNSADILACVEIIVIKNMSIIHLFCLCLRCALDWAGED